MVNRNIDFATLRAIPILDVAQELGIDVKGTKAMCFAGHDKKTPSLSFWKDKNTWKCFGCGLSGSTIDLVQCVLEFPTVIDAAKWLSRRFRHGYAASYSTHKPSHPREANRNARQHTDARPDSKNISDPDVYEWLINHCPLGQSGEHFLVRVRNLSIKTVRHFGVCELRSPKRAYEALLKNWGNNRLVRCGLINKFSSPQSKHSVDKFIWFQHCLLIPFMENGKVVYLQARSLEDRGPKYIGLSGVSKPMFNIAAIEEAPKNSDVYICEGVTDTLAAAELGWRAVGVLGATSFRPEWVALFKDVQPLIVPDNDKAGRNFRISIQRSFIATGRVVNSISMGEYNDLSDFVQNRKSSRNRPIL